jgi:hypothetical protein
MADIIYIFGLIVFPGNASADIGCLMSLDTGGMTGSG